MKRTVGGIYCGELYIAERFVLTRADADRSEVRTSKKLFEPQETAAPRMLCCTEALEHAHGAVSDWVGAVSFSAMIDG
jgi:hypothetical protein